MVEFDSGDHRVIGSGSPLVEALGEGASVRLSTNNGPCFINYVVKKPP